VAEKIALEKLLLEKRKVREATSSKPQ